MANLSSTHRNGPWGGNGGAAKDVTAEPQRLESITIRSGWAIDSLEFSYIEKNGQRHTNGPWGGDGGYKHTITLQPTEFIMEVSGTYGTYADETVVLSLKFVTNMHTYGPFGRSENNNGTSFSGYGPVVGFHGHCKQYLNSIGTYTMSQLTKNGPWGGDKDAAQDVTVVPQRLNSITIGSGQVIDSLAFSYIGTDGQRHKEGPWGRDGGSSKQKITLQPTEFISEVSGTYGTYDEKTLVLSLKFVTNKRTYGPFGSENNNGTSFSSDDGIVLGFHGRCGNYLNSIGTYTV